MLAQVSPTTRPAPSKRSTIVLSGFGIKVNVRHRQLVLEDGVGRDRRVLKLPRATGGLERLIVLGSRSGAVSLEALGFIRDVGASLIVIDRDLDVILTSAGRGLDDARLRLAQARAVGGPVALAVGKYLLGLKLRHQADALARLGLTGAARDEVIEAAHAAANASTMDELLAAERAGAKPYWDALAQIPIMFVRSDLPSIPEHWSHVGSRTSPISGSQKTAANPAHAAFNLAHAIAEAEAKIACTAVGLDPGLALVHSVQRNKDGLSFDLQEAVRAQVEVQVLRVFARRPLSRRDLHEGPKGEVRLLPPLRDEIAAGLSPMLSTELGSVVERVAQMIADSSDQKIGKLATNLSGRARSGGRDGLRKRAPMPRRRIMLGAAQICRGCGEQIPTGRRLCDECLAPDGIERAERFSSSGRQALERLRAEGRDPSKTPEAEAKMVASKERTLALDREWNTSHQGKPDPEVYRREILPLIRRIPLRLLADATELSESHLSFVRRGTKIPHQRHWETLQALGSNARSRA
jgi:CRISPR/Cas system-associated endonuclease Cas1